MPTMTALRQEEEAVTGCIGPVDCVFGNGKGCCFDRENLVDATHLGAILHWNGLATLKDIAGGLTCENKDIIAEELDLYQNPKG
jgi:hypothetical protein